MNFDSVDEQIIDLFGRIYEHYGETFPFLPEGDFREEWKRLNVFWSEEVEDAGIARVVSRERHNKFTPEFIAYLTDDKGIHPHHKVIKKIQQMKQRRQTLGYTW